MSQAPAIARPKAPAERTFVVAVTVLCLAAIAQLVAVVVALAPQVDLSGLGHSLSPRATGTAAAPVASAPDDQAKAQQANALMDEGDQFRAQGNFQGALQAVTEADRLFPGNAGFLLQMAHDYVSLKKYPEAIAVLNRIAALPPATDPADRSQRDAQALLAQLGGATSPTSAAAAPAAPDPTGGVRDEVGIPIGSVMGIVKAEMLNGEPGQKNLRVATKAASSQSIDGQKFVATVDFYEQDDHGQIQHNDAPQVTEWLSYPINWAGDPELFQTKYRLPADDRGDLPPIQYYGYVVAIYYNGELQDSRAEPVALLDKFPPPLHKSAASE